VALDETADGRASHRAGMELLGVRVDEGSDEASDAAAAVRVGVAGSVAHAHLLAPDPIGRQHGSGLPGVATGLGTLEVHSLVRGPWEVRLARLESLEPGVDGSALQLRVGGWAVSAETAAADPAHDGAVRARAGELTSTLVPLLGGDADAAVVTRSDASPLGPASAVPTLTFPAQVGAWVGALVELRGVETQVPTASVALDETADGRVATVTWPDGVRTASGLYSSDPAMAADR
jgi:hypothetical protein